MAPSDCDESHSHLQRIAKGKFSLDGQDYALAVNNGPNSLHGGLKAFDKSVWTVLRTSVTADRASVTFGLKTVDGDNGFPGTLHAESEFVLSAANEMTFAFRATVEGKATPINMCKCVHKPPGPSQGQARMHHCLPHSLTTIH